MSNIVTGGDITEIKCSNTTLGEIRMFPVAGEAGNYDTGGYRGADDGIVDGGGRLINALNRKPWYFDVPVVNDMVNTNEYEFMVAIAGSPDDTTWTFSNVNGAVYSGKGTIQGDLKLDGQKSTFQLKVVGGGQLVKQ